MTSEWSRDNPVGAARGCCLALPIAAALWALLLGALWLVLR